MIPTLALLRVERSLLTAGARAATGTLPGHEMAELLASLSDDVRRVREDMVAMQRATAVRDRVIYAACYNLSTSGGTSRAK